MAENLAIIGGLEKSFLMWDMGMHKSLFRMSLRDNEKRRTIDNLCEEFCCKREQRNGTVADKGMGLRMSFLFMFEEGKTMASYSMLVGMIQKRGKFFKKRERKLMAVGGEITANRKVEI